MCQNCSNKLCGNCSNNADGTAYSPAKIAQWINSHLLPGASVNEVKSAYPKVMIYFDANNITPTEENITKYAEDLKKVIQDPDYLEKFAKIADEKKASKSFSWKPLIGILALVIVFIAFIKSLR
jgi:hypothetical protein